MSNQDDISAAIQGIRSRLGSLAGINETNILIPGGPQERYHQIIEGAHATLGLAETQLDELRNELEYQHKRLDEARDTALASTPSAGMPASLRELDMSDEQPLAPQAVYTGLVNAIPLDEMKQMERQLFEEEDKEFHCNIFVPVHLIVEKRPTDFPDESVMVTLQYDGWYLTEPITATIAVESFQAVLMHFGITQASRYDVRPKPKLAALEYEPLWGDEE